jgi:hypothetical protein
MTSLKKMPVSSVSKDDVYVWTRSRGGKKTSRRAPAASGGRKKETDPMSIPWGDIVETPLRLLKRIFDRG